MHIARLCTDNFRAVKRATLRLPLQGVLTGGNNNGKTTVLEALDLVLGPDRFSRMPPIRQRDFDNGHYVTRPPATEGRRRRMSKRDRGQGSWRSMKSQTCSHTVCNEVEMSAWIQQAASSVEDACSPPPPRVQNAASTDGNAHLEFNFHGPD